MDVFFTMVFLSVPLALLSVVLASMRATILKRKGIDYSEDHMKTFFQFFISLLFTASVLFLYLLDEISLGDGIPLFVSIFIYAADKFLIGFRNRSYMSPASKADELRKWKEHLNEGTISRPDFEKQKNKILNGG
jgi:preprotein translocase subunit SecY